MKQNIIIAEQYAKEIVRLNKSIESYDLRYLPEKIKLSMNKAILTVRHLFPNMSQIEAKNFIYRVYVNSKLATMDLDERYTEYLIDRTVINDKNDVLISESPCIFSAFHFGSYKIITRVMLKKGVKLAVLVSNDLYDAMSIEIDESNAIAERRGWEGRATLIDTSSILTIRKMLKLTKNGWSILMYVDGSTGINGMKRNDENCIPIDFLETSIIVRKGISHIARISKLPVVPVYCQSDLFDTRELTIYEPIYPTLESSENTILKKLYSLHMSKLLLYPEQWEGYLFLFNFIKPKRKIYKQNADREGFDITFFSFVLDRFSFVELDDGFYAVRNSDLIFVKLPKEFIGKVNSGVNLFKVNDFKSLGKYSLRKMLDIEIILPDTV